MKSASTQSCRDYLAGVLYKTRTDTLDLLSQIEEATFFRQVHSEFSPIGWHFGHVAFIEAYWIADYLAGSPLSFPDAYQRLFAADGLPKQERQNLPSITTIAEYLATVRQSTLEYLATAPIANQQRLWLWLIQHESQHVETISFLLSLHQQSKSNIANFSNTRSPNHNSDKFNLDLTEMMPVAAGEYTLGNNLFSNVLDTCLN